MNFADYMSFDNFMKLYKYENNRKEINDKWREGWAIVKKETFEIPLFKFLKDYRDTKGLMKIQHSEGHETTVQYVWNNFVENKKIEEDYLMRVIPDAFYKVLDMHVMNTKEEKETSEDIKNKYNKFMNFMTKGDFARYDLSEDGCTCGICGQRMRMVINNWKPVFGLIHKPGMPLGFYEPMSCLDDNVVDLPVTFKTGNLLLADWFRIESVTKMVEYNKDYTGEGINSAFGRILSAKHHLENFNMISVSLGNCSPSVYDNGEGLVFGRLKNGEGDEPTTYKDKGSVCTDLWAVSIIEKEQLIVLTELANQQSKEDATKVVEDYIKECNPMQLSVKPGEYTLSFHGDYNSFAKKLKDKELADDNIKPYFILKNNEFKKENKLKVKAKAKAKR